MNRVRAAPMVGQRRRAKVRWTYVHAHQTDRLAVTNWKEGGGRVNGIRLPCSGTGPNQVRWQMKQTKECFRAGESVRCGVWCLIFFLWFLPLLASGANQAINNNTVSLVGRIVVGVCVLCVHVWDGDRIVSGYLCAHFSGCKLGDGGKGGGGAGTVKKNKNKITKKSKADLSFANHNVYGVQ